MEGRAKASQSSAGELVHRSSAIYASGRAEKYRQPLQYGAVRVTTRCGGSVSILTGYTTSGRFRHDASSYLYGSVPTNIPRLLLSFNLAPPPSAFRSYTRSHLLSFPSHSYLLHPRLFPRRCLLYSARFRGCVME